MKRFFQFTPTTALVLDTLGFLTGIALFGALLFL